MLSEKYQAILDEKKLIAEGLLIERSLEWFGSKLEQLNKKFARIENKIGQKWEQKRLDLADKMKVYIEKIDRENANWKSYNKRRKSFLKKCHSNES